MLRIILNEIKEKIQSGISVVIRFREEVIMLG